MKIDVFGIAGTSIIEQDVGLDILTALKQIPNHDISFENVTDELISKTINLASENGLSRCLYTCRHLRKYNRR